MLMDYMETVAFHTTPKTIELDMVSAEIMQALNHHCNTENSPKEIWDQCDSIRISIALYQSGMVDFESMLNIIQAKPIPENTTDNKDIEKFISYLHIIKSLHSNPTSEKIFNSIITKILTLVEPEKYPLYQEANRNF